MVRKRARRTNRKNPSKVGIKRDVWINAKIRVTKGGKIQAKVPASAVRRGNPKWKEYTLYPGGITFPTAVDAKAALIAARRDYPSAYVITPSGKRLKVGKGY